MVLVLVAVTTPVQVEVTVKGVIVVVAFIVTMPFRPGVGGGRGVEMFKETFRERWENAARAADGWAEK